MKTAALQAEGLWKKYRLLREPQATLLQTALSFLRWGKREDLQVLRDINFTAHRGESLAIIGANGAGKTTLLKTLAGILFAEKGSLAINGKISALLELGAGFQPELTGRDNLYLNATILGLTRKEISKRLHKIVEFAGLEHFMDVPVKYYSTGMYMRLGFAVAVHVDANIILIDEVFAVGDEVFQYRCLERLLEIKRAGGTLILVSHDMNLVKRIADRVIWINDGTIQQEGTPDEIISMYCQGSAGESSTGQRWGSREVEIRGVNLKCLEGNIQKSFKPNQGMTIDISFAVKQAVQRPVIGFSIFNQAGVLLVGNNSLNHGLLIPELKNDGQISLHLQHLPLPPGTYSLSVAITDISGAKPYDYHDKMYTFEVVTGDFHQGTGIITLPQTWKLD